MRMMNTNSTLNETQLKAILRRLPKHLGAIESVKLLLRYQIAEKLSALAPPLREAYWSSIKRSFALPHSVVEALAKESGA